MIHKNLVIFGIAICLCCGEAFALGEDKLLALKRVNVIAEVVMDQQKLS